MSSTIRERAAARARLERQMSEKLEKARKRKQRNAYIGAGAAVVLVAGGIVWAITSIDKKPADTAGDPSVCVWSPEDVAANPNLKEIGTPPLGKAPNTGTQKMTITMNVGTLEVEMKTASAPCTARSMTYLAGKDFFDNTKCHRITTSGIHVLQCGDPAGNGMGGPTYKLAEENLPNFIDEKQNYPSGTIAMAKGQNPGTTGSQFFIVWGDTPLSGDYTVLGTVTKGIELIQEVGKAGAKLAPGQPAPSPGAGPITDGAPVNDITIKDLTVTPAQG